MQFYLACMEGTGQLERGFSVYAAALDAHSGQRTRTDNAPDHVEIMTEVCLDGPEDGSGMFDRNIFGYYKPTPFAKECAEMWIRLRGRRFGSYAKRKDAGTKRQPRRGTILAVRQRQTLGLDRLADRKRTSGRLAGITSYELGEMKRRVEKSPAPQTKAMKDFFHTTQERKNEKGRFTVWRGFGTRPPLRVKPRSVVLPAPSRESGSVDGEKLVLAVEGRNERLIYKILPGHALSKAAGFKVDSKMALYENRVATQAKMLVWLNVIARGLVAREVTSGKLRSFSASAAKVEAAVSFTDLFEEKHKAVAMRFRELASKPASKWKAVDANAKNAHIIDTMEGFRMFLLAAQRVPEGSLSFSSRCRPSRPL